MFCFTQSDRNTIWMLFFYERCNICTFHCKKRLYCTLLPCFPVSNCGNPSHLCFKLKYFFFWSVFFSLCLILKLTLCSDLIYFIGLFEIAVLKLYIFSHCSADERFDATFHTNVLVNASGACQYIPPGKIFHIIDLSFSFLIVFDAIYHSAFNIYSYKIYNNYHFQIALLV